MHEPLLSVVLPGFNEVEGLPRAVEAYRSAFAAAGLEHYELILVDDCSTDGTGPLADQLAASDPRVRVLHHARNLGQVEGILGGFRAARGAVLTHNGIDLPFAPSDSLRALACMETAGADVVVVERIDRRSYGPTRWALSRANVMLLRLLLGSPFQDHNFVQFFRRDLLRQLPVVTRGVSTVTAELILRARRAGYRVARLPAEYHRRATGKSTITGSKVARTGLELMRLWCALGPASRLSTRNVQEIAS